MEIYEKLNKIQSELKAPKGQYNKFGKYSYRSCEDILEALKPHLLKYGCVVTLTDDMQLIGDRYYLKATATITDAESGKSVSNIALAREDKERAGMSESQITGTASSYARKYALNGLFLIDDTKDADTDAYHEQTHADKKQSEDPKVAAAVAKANDVKKLLVKISGDKAVAKQLWDEKYAKDKGDIVKMNAALLELEEQWRKIEEMQREIEQA
jgi:hypothetical protein